jgi:uncharacterized membrane protein
MPDPLERPATTRLLLDLAEAGLVDNRGIRVALSRIDRLPTPASLTQAVRVVMGLLGVLALVASVALLIAANLSGIPGPVLIGGCMALVLSAGLGAVRLGLHTRGGEALALVSGVLIGPMLAVFGQVYQSGADAWQLFALWSALLIGSVVATRSHGLIVLWVVLVHVTGTLLSKQHFGVDTDDGPFAVVAAALVLFDAGVMAWFVRATSGVAARRIVLAVALVTLALPTLPLCIGELNGGHDWALFLGLFAMTTFGVAAFYFRTQRLDVAALAMVGASVMVHLTALLGYLIIDSLDLFPIFFLGVAVIGQAAALAFALRAAAREAS